MTMTRMTRPPGVAGWRLGKRSRKVTLLVHIVSAGAWIGIDVIVAVLVGVGWFADSDSTRGAAYQALGLFVAWPMLTSAVVCLASGVLLGLGSKYGLVRFWWVAVKLFLNLLLTTLILVALQPEIAEIAEYGRSISAGEPIGLDVSDLFFPPIVSLTLLTFATALSIFKPWGRMRRR
jgi:hypothetical protein